MNEGRKEASGSNPRKPIVKGWKGKRQENLEHGAEWRHMKKKGIVEVRESIEMGSKTNREHQILNK